MKAIQKLIYTGFAAVAIASASMPVFPAHTMPDANWRGVENDRGQAPIKLIAQMPD